MAGFTEALRAFALKAKYGTREVFVRTAQLVQESVVVGSPITGAPGQPVDTGNLANSWHLNVGQTEALLSTNVVYAPVIEDNVRGVVFRNHGPHSVKLTVAGFDKLVDAAAREVTGRG